MYMVSFVEEFCYEFVIHNLDKMYITFKFNSRFFVPNLHADRNTGCRLNDSNNILLCWIDKEQFDEKYYKNHINKGTNLIERSRPLLSRN